MSEVVEMKPKAKAKAKAKKPASKKVTRGLKETTAKEAERLEAEAASVVSDDVWTPAYANEAEANNAKAPSLEQVERDIAAFYAGAQPLKYGFFERAFDNLRFVAAYLNRRVPRLVWVGQRIDIDVRWDQTKNAITVHYRGPFKKVK